MATNDSVKIAFVWSDIRRPIGGAEYFLLDILSNIKTIFTAVNSKIEIAVYNIDQGLSLIEELNNYDAVVLYSLNRGISVDILH